MSSQPPPPPPQPESPPTPTTIAGQESAPATAVPPAPPDTYAYSAAARSRYNSTAIVSLVVGALSVFGHIALPGVGGGTLALVAIVTGFIARGQIKQSGEQGMWMATVGIVLGIVHIALVIVVIVLALLFGIAVLGFLAFHH